MSPCAAASAWVVGDGAVARRRDELADVGGGRIARAVHDLVAVLGEAPAERCADVARADHCDGFGGRVVRAEPGHGHGRCG